MPAPLDRRPRARSLPERWRNTGLLGERKLPANSKDLGIAWNLPLLPAYLGVLDYTPSVNDVETGSLTHR